MSFIDAVKVCFTKYADFTGCASRSEFWWFTLFTLVGSVALEMIGDGVSLAFTVATLLPGSAVTSRRLHDTDRSGYWQLLALIPVLGWIVLAVWWAQPSVPSAYCNHARVT